MRSALDGADRWREYQRWDDGGNGKSGFGSRGVDWVLIITEWELYNCCRIGIALGWEVDCSSIIR